MNAVSFLSQVSMSSSSNKLNANDRNIEKSSFMRLLDSTLLATNVDLGSMNSEITQGDLTSLQHLVLMLLDNTPFNDVETNGEMLSIPFVEDFMNELPLELKLDIEEVVDSKKPLLEIVGSFEEELQHPAELLALILTLATEEERILLQEEEQIQLQNDNEVNYRQIVAIVTTQLEKMIPILVSANQHDLSDHSGTMKSFVQILTANLQTLSSEEKNKLTETFDKLKSNIDRIGVLLSTFSRGSTEMPLTTQGIVLPHHQQLSQLQQFALHVGEGQSEQQASEKLLKQFQSILGRSTLVQFPNGLNQLTIKLFPEHLGRLDVKLSQQNGVIVAQLVTSTEGAKKLVESQLHQLRQAFIAQNIQVEKIEIQSQQQQLLQQSDKQNDEEQSKQEQSNHRKQEEESKDEEVSFQDFLNETINLKV